MVGELIPTPFDPRMAGRDSWTRFHELRRLQQEETRPEEPVEPDADVEAQMTRENAFEYEHRFEISLGETMLSWMSATTVKPDNPEYETNKHLFWADAYVRPANRGQGIASLWLPTVAELMDRHGCTVLGLHASVEPGHAFLKWLGAEPKLRNVVSRLELSQVDWEMVERWAAEGASRNPATRLEIYDGGVPESMWPEFAPQMTAMFNTMPLEDLDLGTQIFTPELLRDFSERRAMSGEVLYTVLTREPNGSITGLTDTGWAAYRRTVLHQWFTGVRSDAQGRGLGKWIKAAMLVHVRELHPDLECVVTDNAQSNGPMLKINRALGFKEHRVEVHYQISRAALEARIRSL
ncbi:MAG TPA: GNAT family N-acetyltransferase [Candidatus Udaeobacter sp.]|nr:GNAT family N-acetyltransferase [Candidatus Udaeobacter sp.]